MSSIKCSSCGYRNLYSTVLRICTNCGATLPSSMTMPEESADASVPSQVPALPAPELSLKKSTAMQVYPGSALARRSESEQSIQPYQVSAFPVPTGIEENEQFQTIVQDAKESSELPLPMRGRLPRGLPRRQPDITGRLIYVQTQTYHSATSDLANAFFRQFFGAIWTTPSEQQSKEREKVVTRMRIRTFSGEQRDAYLEGMLTGANVALGDDVSLWGRMRKGTLITQRAYNHTTRSRVTSNATISSGPMLGILVLLLVAVLAWTLWFHIPLLPQWP